jgi:tRNA threonylcarbamoyladenosine biosynthesis protein TsaE
MDSNFHIKNIDEAAVGFIEMAGPRRVIAFHGEMGAGKTTFIKAICRQLGVMDNVSSPTFSIINEYKTGDKTKVYHMDLYRLKNEEEALMAGIEECFYSGQWCFIEWPDKAPGILPVDTMHCYLTALPADERKLQIKL